MRKTLIGLKVVSSPHSSYKKSIPPLPSVAPSDSAAVEKFLQSIGRGCIDYIGKIPTWQKLFESNGKDLKTNGIPIAVRKYILKWTEYFRLGKDPVAFPLIEKQLKKKKFPIV